MDEPEALPRLRWDVFCRVVDNHGDLGVCWRLARRLEALGQRVRLWIDDDRALAWMAPDRSGLHIETHGWAPPPAELGDVIVETFGGDLPEGWLERMATAPRPPLWIDVEYLSAEGYVERSHGLPSPQSVGPGAGLTRWFFYPGFTSGTGGLLMSEPDAQAGQAVLRELGIAPSSATTLSLFGYAQPQLDAAITAWRSTPTRVLACPGPASQQLAARLGVSHAPGAQAHADHLHVHWLPWLAQTDYDALLATCDLNLVRGEDSFASALASGQPFLWQLYPQHDGAQFIKLDAFLDRYLAAAPADLAVSLRAAFQAWNASAPASAMPAPASPWRHHAQSFAQALHAEQDRHGDLGLRLLRFALAKLEPPSRRP